MWAVCGGRENLQVEQECWDRRRTNTGVQNKGSASESWGSRVGYSNTRHSHMKSLLKRWAPPKPFKAICRWSGPRTRVFRKIENTFYTDLACEEHILERTRSIENTFYREHIFYSEHILQRPGPRMRVRISRNKQQRWCAVRIFWNICFIFVRQYTTPLIWYQHLFFLS